MIKHVKWSDDAIETVERIKKYLVENWSELVADNFVNEIESKIEVLKQFPEIGRPSEKDKGVRKIKVAKHVVLYYRDKKRILEILNFFDQRQHPDKSKY
jgi:plasmid stabilization system protein ParE